MERLVFHIDVNSAFLSWEAARRVAAGEPDLRLVPSAIGGDLKTRTGIILAKSIPAKAYGVRTGEPIGMALQKCPQLQLAKPDFSLYEECSRNFMEICCRYTPVVEKFSIDECFLDMSGMQRIYPDPIATAHKIKDEIRDMLGFTVNVGVGSNKLLAKMASDFEKPDRVHTLFQSEIREKMWKLPVGDLFTVGRNTSERLKNARISTIGALAETDLQILRAIVGDKMAVQLHRYANGIDDSPVLAEAEEAKGYSNSTTVAQDIITDTEAYRILLALSDSVTSRMRMDGKQAYCVCVTIRRQDFRDQSHQKKLPEPTDVTSEVYETAKQLFRELWDHRTPLRLLGVSLTQLTEEGGGQLSIFPDERRERERELDRLMDSIRKRFGADTVVRGSVMDCSKRIAAKEKAKAETEKKRTGTEKKKI